MAIQHAFMHKAKELFCGMVFYYGISQNVPRQRFDTSYIDLVRSLNSITYKSQSTAMIRLISSVGSPTAVSTSIIVIRPALGTLAAPTLANVAVKLRK